ncbi:MAG: hypothetical protein ACETWG_01125 [Candidatus Neomarinimicrobiota bacterium]
MRPLHLLLVVTVLALSLSCLSENPLTSPDASQITVSITLPRGEAVADNSTDLGKALVVTSVTLTVTASDMETIEESLTISSNGKTASGTVEVPKGDDRTFAIECRDANGIPQYSGSTTHNISEDTETVTITTVGHYPGAVTVSVDDISAFAVSLSWTRSNEPDFAAYDVVRSETSDLSPATRERLVRIPNKNTTAYSDTSARLNRIYYYGVVVWDTEGLGMRSDAVGVNTPRWVELAYDDGEPTSGYSWSTDGAGSANILTASSPSRLLTARYYLTNIAEGGRFTSVIIGYDNEENLVILGSKVVEATETGWLDVLYYSDEIVVEGNFFVMILYDGIDKPYFGYDPVDNDRAWDYDGTSWSEWDQTYFMRAWVELPGGLLKELTPVAVAGALDSDSPLDPVSLAPLLAGEGTLEKGMKTSAPRQ